MSLLETVFTLQSHAFLKCHCFFVDEPSFPPSCFSVAECSFVSDFVFIDYFLLQFLLTSILLSGVFLSDLIFNHPSWTGWNQRSEIVNPPLLLELNNCHGVYPNSSLVPCIWPNLIQRTEYLPLRWLFKKPPFLQHVFFQSLFVTATALHPNLFLDEAIWRYVDSAVSYDCEEWRSGPWCP